MSNILIIDKDGKLKKKLKKVSTSDKRFNEASLQQIIYKQPEILRANLIDENHDNLISLGTEVQVDAGKIDVLLTNPSGSICIVETKLWRNSQAHREVLAQLLDYVQGLSCLTFQEFAEKITKRSGPQAISEYYKLLGRVDDPIEYQNNIEDTLRHGRFLLLVVGDKIYPNVLLLTDVIQSAPHLEFTIGLVELELYNHDEDGFIVVPRVIGRTLEETRAVIKIQYEEKKPDVEVTTLETDSSGTGKTDLKEFLASMPNDFVEVFKRYFDDWTNKGYFVSWRTKGFSIRVIVNGRYKTVFEISPTYTCIYSRKYAGNRNLENSITAKYREALQENPIINRYLMENRSFIYYKDIDMETFETHLQESTRVIDELHSYYQKRS